MMLPAYFNGDEAFLGAKPGADKFWTVKNLVINIMPFFREFQDHEEQILCHKCHPGSYSDKMGTANCIPCKVMKYQPVAGKRSCLDCPPYKKMTITGAVSCNNNCKPGTISPHNNNKCENCKPGRFQPGAGAMLCMDCRLGWYQNKPGQVKCIQAKPGTSMRLLGWFTLISFYRRLLI